jgi:flagellar motor switch/type III secretory pathway protein FliN
MILLPEEVMPEQFQAAWVKNLSEALGRGEVSSAAAMVPLAFSHEDKQATLSLVWPASQPAAVIAPGEDPPKPQEKPAPKAAGPKPTAAGPTRKPDGAPKFGVPKSGRTSKIHDLPLYARSLLKVKVPVVVTLARKRQPVGRIVELGPGSIIQFDKSCEEMLDLEVGAQPVAVGEAVKVGDKFGLRITSIVLPEERFKTVSR